MIKNNQPNLPAWDRTGLFDINGTVFQGLKRQLLTVTRIVNALCEHTDTSYETTSELATQIDRARIMLWTLLTACRASRSLSAFDAAVLSEQNDLLLISSDLNKAASICITSIRKFPDDSRVRHFPHIQQWLISEKANGLESFDYSILHRNIYEPLSNLYRHIRSRMVISVDNSALWSESVNYSLSQAVGIMKNSDDPILRKKTFCAMNSWFSERGAIFADLINAISGYREEVSRICGEGSFSYFIRSEQIKIETLQAMNAAVKDALPITRKSVTLRTPLFGSQQMHASHLLSPPPSNLGNFRNADKPIAYQNITSLTESLKKTLTEIEPQFASFLEEELEGHWIETRHFSGKTGGGWCDNLPFFNAVAIFSDYQPGGPAAFSLSHLAGVAVLYHTLKNSPAKSHKIPLTVIETAGMLAAVSLEQNLLKESSGTSSELHVLWQSLTTITNELIVLPFRHELSKKIQLTRSTGTLTAQKLNSLTNEIWSDFFGDTTISSDQYIWAYKHHFYLENPFYDFQYVFGYLLAIVLRETLSSNNFFLGKDYRISQFFVDQMERGSEFACWKHLKVDITRKEFWKDAIHLAIKPIWSIEGSELLRNQFQGFQKINI